MLSVTARNTVLQSLLASRVCSYGCHPPIAGKFLDPPHGGALACIGCEQLRVQDSSFDSNAATIGGAIFAVNLVKGVQMKGSWMTANQGGSEGGSVALANTVGEVTNCTFSKSEVSVPLPCTQLTLSVRRDLSVPLLLVEVLGHTLVAHMHPTYLQTSHRCGVATAHNAAGAIAQQQAA